MDIPTCHRIHLEVNQASETSMFDRGDHEMAVNIGASELGQRLAKRLVFDGDDLFWRNLLALGHETVGAANADAPTVRDRATLV